MMDSTHITQEDLVMYAMHALAPDETSNIEAHLRQCAQCREFVAETRGDMALLALSVDQVALPAGAEERFFNRITSSTETPVVTAAESKVVPFESSPVRRRSVWPVLIPWALAASLGGICISFGVDNKNLRDTVNAESNLLTSLSAKAALAQQVVDVLQAPHAQHVTLTATKTPPAPTGHAVYLADRGSLLFEANNLKPLDPGKIYELWVIPVSGSAPVPAGTFKPDAAGYATLVLPKLPSGVAAKAFGVTIENAPGATTPTMPIILAGG